MIDCLVRVHRYLARLNLSRPVITTSYDLHGNDNLGDMRDYIHLKACIVLLRIRAMAVYLGLSTST